MAYYVSSNGFYGTNNAKGFFCPCGVDVLVTKLEKVYETEAVFVTVQFYVGDHLQEVRCSFNDIIKEMGLKGYPVATAQTASLYQYLQQQTSSMNAVTIHTDMGWNISKEGNLVFRGPVMLGKKSTYFGNYNIAGHGKIEDFRSDFSSVIQGNIPLETSVVIGLSACMVGYLSVMGAEVPTLIFDINGRSTTGKTTCSKLAVSMGGLPQKCPDKISLSGTCSTTVNALYGVLNNNYGYPMLFDEIARLGRYADYSGMVYAISDGTDKSRMSSDSKVKPPKHWATSVIFTGEFSLLSNASNADGLIMRVIPFNNVKWTNSAEQAHQIEAFSGKYAGLPILHFAKYLLELIPDGVISLYFSHVSSLTKRIPMPSCYQERLAKSVAVMAITAEMAEKALKVKMQVNSIIDFVLDSLRHNVPLSEAQKAFEYVSSMWIMNKSKFAEVNGDGSKDKINDCWGNYRSSYIHKNKHGESVESELLTITEVRFKEWMLSGKFSTENVLIEWRDKGVIYCTKPDRFFDIVSVQPKSGRAKCIRIILNNGVYPVTSASSELIEFSKLFCKELLEKEYEKYTYNTMVEPGMKQAVQRTVKYLTEESIDKAFGQQIITDCFKLTVDFPKIQSYLYGSKLAEWQKKLENHKTFPDKYEQIKLTDKKTSEDSDNGDI